MPKLLDSKLEGMIRAFSKMNLSSRQIKSKLADDGHDVSQKTICNVLNTVGIRRKALLEGLPNPRFRRQPLKRTDDLIRKVKSMVTKQNPPSYTRMQSLTGVSRSTLWKIIHSDLQLKTRKKSRVHRLNQKSKKNRKTNCRKLYEKHLAGAMSEFVVTLDEALVYLEESNGQRQICYLNAREEVPENWVFEKSESFKTGFMVIGIITGRGKLPLLRVPSKVKINAQYYVDYVLKPLFEKYLPSLYPKDMSKIFFHHDKATSHTAAKTQAYLEQMKMKFGIFYQCKGHTRKVT